MPKSLFLRLTWTIPHQKRPPTNMDPQKTIFFVHVILPGSISLILSFIHFYTFLSLIHFIHSIIDSFMHRFIDSSIHWFIHYFVSFHFISCHVISFHSFHFMSFHFMSFHSFHFMSCHVISCHVISFHSFISFIHFMRSFIHFISFRLISFHSFIHSFILSITHALLHATVRMRFVTFGRKTA